MVRNTAREIAIHLSYELSFTSKEINALLDERLQVLLGNENHLTTQIEALVGALPTVYKNNGEDANGRLDMLFYADADTTNDKAIYTPADVLDDLNQMQQKPLAAVQVLPWDGWQACSTHPTAAWYFRTAWVCPLHIP